MSQEKKAPLQKQDRKKEKQKLSKEKVKKIRGGDPSISASQGPITLL